MTAKPSDWPSIPFEPWQATCEALHLWCQIVGKYRLKHAFWVNHSWHATLYVTARGLTTGPIPDPNMPMTVTFDFFGDRLLIEAASGRVSGFALGPMSVATFREKFGAAVEELGGDCEIHGRPNELPEPLPFLEDTAARPYDAEAVRRFHQALLRIHNVFARFRTAFHGKVSPAHLFWGSFDLAITRFSGRTAPPHPGGVPFLPDDITREAYSHEVSSAGFWPGNGYGEPMFYSYAYPTPNGFSDQSVSPEGAFWHPELGEFLLPYEVVRGSENPDETLLAFLQSTYEAAAKTAEWDRTMERPVGKRGRPHN